MSESSLSGRTCLVTGGSRGLGYAIALALKQLGAKVFLLASNGQTLKKSADVIGAEPITADLANVVDLDRVIDDFFRRGESVDILVNAAGVFPVANIFDSNVAEFDRCMAVNAQRLSILLERSFQR